jgi:hypothetical protein
MSDGKMITHSNANGMSGLSSVYGSITGTTINITNQMNHLFVMSRRFFGGRTVCSLVSVMKTRVREE